MAETANVQRRNWWSLTSLTFGIASLLLSFIAYVPFIPLVSWLSFPFGLSAMIFGWLGGKQAKAANDSAAARRAVWGIRLGCLAWIVEVLAGVLTVLILSGLLFAGFAAWWTANSK